MAEDRMGLGRDAHPAEPGGSTSRAATSTAHIYSQVVGVTPQMTP